MNIQKLRLLSIGLALTVPMLIGMLWCYLRISEEHREKTFIAENNIGVFSSKCFVPPALQTLLPWVRWYQRPTLISVEGDVDYGTLFRTVRYLEKLELRSPNLRNRDLESIGDCMHLKELYIRFDHQLTKEVIPSIAECKSLDMVDLPQLALDRASFEVFSEMPCLETLYLHDSIIPNEKDLAVLLESKSLKTVDLRWSNVSPETVDWLRQKNPEINVWGD